MNNDIIKRYQKIEEQNEYGEIYYTYKDIVFIVFILQLTNEILFEQPENIDELLSDKEIYDIIEENGIKYKINRV